MRIHDLESNSLIFCQQAPPSYGNSGIESPCGPWWEDEDGIQPGHNID